jgi:nucleoside-diphosphate-sugar epimerase
MRILVTGSSGFIGGHVLSALTSDGHDVDGIDVRPRAPNAPGTHLMIDVRHLYLANGAEDNAVGPHVVVPHAEYDAIIHLAAFGGVARASREPRFIFQTNIEATAHLVEQCQKLPNLKRIILASSFSVYGSGSPVPWTEETPVNPLETYAASKLGQELAFRGHDLPLSILRFSSVYGRNMRLADPEATIVAKLAGWISRDDDFELNEDGFQTRDFVHVNDVIDAIRALLAIEGPLLGEQKLVNVCTGDPISLRDAVERLMQVIGKRPTVTYNGRSRPGDTRNCYGSPSRLRKLLGRGPTKFHEGALEAFGGLQ